MNQYFSNNDNLKSERRVIKYNYGSSCFTFISDNGIFSKEHIDYGSELLVKAYLQHRKEIKTFLDVGCGYGYITILLAKLTNTPGLGVDVNRRALKLAEESALLNEVSATFKESNGYSNVNGKYDLIITNPPIRAGNKVVYEILEGAKDYLTTEGELWFVIRKNQGAKSIKKQLEKIYKIEIKEKSKGFYIFMAKNN